MNTQTQAKWQVDECEDANGYFTVRPFDGSKTGDIFRQPIATFYDLNFAELAVQAVNERNKMNTQSRTNEH